MVFLKREEDYYLVFGLLVSRILRKNTKYASARVKPSFGNGAFTPLKVGLDRNHTFEKNRERVYKKNKIIKNVHAKT